MRKFSVIDSLVVEMIEKQEENVSPSKSRLNYAKTRNVYVETGAAESDIMLVLVFLAFPSHFMPIHKRIYIFINCSHAFWRKLVNRPWINHKLRGKIKYNINYYLFQ